MVILRGLKWSRHISAKTYHLHNEEKLILSKPDILIPSKSDSEPKKSTRFPTCPKIEKERFNAHVKNSFDPKETTQLVRKNVKCWMARHF